MRKWCVSLISLNGVTCEGHNPVFFVEEHYSLMYVYHIFLTHMWVDKHHD